MKSKIELYSSNFKGSLNHLTIEILFLFISLVIISFSIYLKSQAETKIIDKKEYLYTLEIAVLEDNLISSKENHIELLNKEFKTYTYFNKELEKDFNNICSLLKYDSKPDSVVFIKALKAFDSQLEIENRRITFGYDSLIYSSLILIAVTIILMIINNANQKKEIEKLNIHNEEQQKISQELHDGVAQDMAALLLFLEQKDIEKSLFVAKQALSEIRFMIGMQHLDLSAGFETILKNVVTTFERNYGIKSEFLSAISNDIQMPTETQLNLIRITQESLSNVAHHSKATSVMVRILEIDNQLKLCISDNGIGLQEASADRKHYGLENIENRTKSLGGTCQIKTDEGTSILISIPYIQQKKKGIK